MLPILMRMVLLVVLSSLWSVTTLGADAGEKSPSVHISVGASLSKKGDTLKGEALIRIKNSTDRSLEEIPLWLYPNRFLDPSSGASDRTASWLYPAGKSRGSMRIESPKWNGEPLGEESIRYEPLEARGKREASPKGIGFVRLPTPLKRGATGTLSIAFEVTIPKRRGRFGRFRGTVSLAGGWFPRKELSKSPFCDRFAHGIGKNLCQ